MPDQKTTPFVYVCVRVCVSVFVCSGYSSILVCQFHERFIVLLCVTGSLQ
jgi:hypothetical protein